MHMFRKAALPAAVGAALSMGLLGSAQAATPGWYFGLSGGQSNFDDNSGNVASELQTVLETDGGFTFVDPGSGIDASVDSSDTMGKVFAGYQFNDYVAVEFTYSDFGSVDAVFTGQADGAEGGEAVDGNASVDITGFGAAVLGILPLGHGFAAFGKVGALRWESSGSGSLTIGTSTESVASVDDKGTEISYGVGARYDINEHLAVRVEWDRFKVGKSEFDPDQLDVISGGVTWKL